jgi:hypothetical protein
MAKTGKTNLTSYSLEKKTLPKGGSYKTQYCSSTVLSKTGSGKEQGRAPGYTLESLKK